ncbi:MAG: class II fumarate hydratase [Candidatus Thorarchaeota archaeon]|nr:MAG: class II fumarate hydratase [Candidatus Thorarchaeota archaeon]
MTGKNRMEKDSLGEMEVPTEVYWGISTQRALQNFRISGRRMPTQFILALAEVKKASALANMSMGEIDSKIGKAIVQAAEEIIADRKFLDQFPIDIYQTGSGTQTNMNMNEVLANRANEILGHPRGRKSPVHPNDHVNMSQSSNDVIPTAMHIAALQIVESSLNPSLKRLVSVLDSKIREFSDIVKVARTHLQDAVPIRLSTEFDVYRRQAAAGLEQIKVACGELLVVPLGGTAVGTGLNAPNGFAEAAVKQLGLITRLSMKTSPLKAEGIASHSAIVGMSAALRSLALSCMKMANDIRWMGSGPRAGLGELLLPENEPGSSIMPGKVNPTQSEALIQVCIQIIGNDEVISLAEGFGSVLDLNVAKPIMIVNLLDSIAILSGGVDSFVEHCLMGLKPNEVAIRSQLERSLMVVTRLTPIIGYDRAAEVAKTAYRTGRTIREAVDDMGIKIEGDLEDILDPSKMA